MPPPLSQCGWLGRKEEPVSPSCAPAAVGQHSFPGTPDPEPSCSCGHLLARPVRWLLVSKGHVGVLVHRLSAVRALPWSKYSAPVPSADTLLPQAMPLMFFMKREREGERLEHAHGSCPPFLLARWAPPRLRSSHCLSLHPAAVFEMPQGPWQSLSPPPPCRRTSGNHRELLLLPAPSVPPS